MEEPVVETVDDPLTLLRQEYVEKTAEALHQKMIDYTVTPGDKSFTMSYSELLSGLVQTPPDIYDSEYPESTHVQRTLEQLLTLAPDTSVINHAEFLNIKIEWS